MNEKDDFTNMIELLLVAPAEQLDPNLFPLIEAWDRPVPKAIQVLEVLDIAVYTGGCTDFVMGIFDVIYRTALENEKISDAEVVENATWRKGMSA